MRWIRSRAGISLLVLLVAGVSIAVGLALAPAEQVHAAGQTVRVGAQGPTLSLSGPAELDLFGQQIPTTTTFDGPVRPRLQLTHLTLSKQLAQFTRSGSSDQLGRTLVAGWEHYFYWQIGIVALSAVVLGGAVAGWLRRGPRASVLIIAAALVVAEVINVGAIMATAYTVPRKLGRIHSLQALVGTSPTELPHRSSGSRSGTTSGQRLVVLGDSTAAGLGNPLVAHPTADDRACRRSRDSYAADLAQARAGQVTNLACSGASIASGLLGPQETGGQTLSPQLSALAVQHATTVIVSVGANDVHWSDLLRACAISASCANKAEQAYFQQQLASFSRDYLDLLSQLEVLPNHPHVVINLYYNPFPGAVGCLKSEGVTASKRSVMVDDLSALNSILAQGAKTAGFATVDPDFGGHGLCSPQPYVQGVDAAAPFHPTAGGELAIALADAPALPQGPSH